MQNNKRVLFTGGHASSTSYAVIKEILDQDKNWELFFIGGRSSFEGKSSRALYSISLPETKVTCYSIISGRLQRRFTRWTIPSLLKIPIGFVQSFILLLMIKPDIVVSFGGYAAFPVVFSGWLLRKKIILHEQTAAAGRANIYSAFFADRIAISRSTSKKYFPKDKTILTGNPISPNLFGLKRKENLSKIPLIFITGGASGSKIINETLYLILDKLLEDYKVVHQTGDIQFEKFKKKQRSLSVSVRRNYTVRSMIPSGKWHKYLKKADLIVSRSGANMVSEILYLKIPAILIPLPIAYLDEQKRNALIVKKVGLAEIIDQSELDHLLLYQKIQQIIDNWDNYTKRSEKYISPDTDAGRKMIKLIEQLL